MATIFLGVSGVADYWRAESRETAKLEWMSFLDSLENNLKALEGTEHSGLDDYKRRSSERQRTAAAAPWAEQLKRSPFVQELMQQATRVGYQIRTKVNFVWIDTMLRLEARNHRLELRPTAEGIAAVYLKGPAEVKRQLIDLKGKPEGILNDWIEMLDAQRKEDLAAAAAHALEEEDSTD
jgi:hypothetical protein